MSCSCAVILIGGPQTGTRFRPLSFKVPKPLFPIGPAPLISHHIKACAKLPSIKHIYLIGNYQSDEPQLAQFLGEARSEFPTLKISYLQEYTTLGTAGALWHFRDILQSTSSSSSHIFIFNGDVLCNFPLETMHASLPNNNATSSNIILTAKSESRRQTLGCLVVAENDDNKVLHFVEKPEDFLPTHISCGVYLLQIDHLFSTTSAKRQMMDDSEAGVISLERDVFPSLVSDGGVYSHCLDSLPGAMHWTQIKSPGNVLTANRLVLSSAKNNVYIHPSAKISPDAVIGPNVSIGANCIINEGVRVKESIILPGCSIGDHSCIVNSIVGWESRIGSWNHIEGVIEKINPNQQHTVFESEQNVYFTDDGTLKKIVTIIGHGVTVKDETSIYSSLILPGKDITYSIKNQIVL